MEWVQGEPEQLSETLSQREYKKKTGDVAQ